MILHDCIVVLINDPKARRAFMPPLAARKLHLTMIAAACREAFAARAALAPSCDAARVIVLPRHTRAALLMSYVSSFIFVVIMFCSLFDVLDIQMCNDLEC